MLSLLTEFERNYTLCIFSSAVYATRNQGDTSSKNNLKMLNDAFGIFNGLDSYSNKIINGEYENNNASALIRRNENTLMIAFRGTDDSKDIFDDMSGVASGDFKRHYKKFDDFIKAVETYLKDHSEIQHIYVTGHSLGGAMTDGFILNHPNTSNYQITGVTFASPGYQKHTPTDLRLTQFEMVSDIVGDTFQNVGNIISLDDHVGGKSISNHGIQNYLDYLQAIQANQLHFNLTENHLSFYRVDIQNQIVKSISTDITGSKTKDILIGTTGDDKLNGLAGNDVLISNGGNDTLTGGTGKDIFEFNLQNPNDSNLISNKITDFLNNTDQVRFISDDLKFSDIQFENKKLSIPKYHFELSFTKSISFKLDKNLIITSQLTSSS